MAFPLFGKKTPSPSQSTAKAGAKHAPLEFAHTQDPSHSAGAARPNIEVQETIHQIPQAIEQAAMLYSIEQPEAAAGALEEAIQSANLDRYAPRAWGMLFELYQVLARRADFDRLAAEYAAKFETSPPTWAAGSGEAKPAPRALANKTVVRLTGVLNAKSQDMLVQALKIAEKNPAVRIEVAKVIDADDQGCALLNNVLGQFKRARKECVIVGADKLAAMLAKRVVPGEREREQVWLLLLNLYQQMADQPAFDDAAVNYAVTFEVSPPSFEATAKRPAALAAKSEPEMESDGDDAGCALEGIITANGDAAFATIRAEAEPEAVTEVVVDVSRLQRMDFVAATNLMNLISSLAKVSKTVRLVKASHLLTALWEVIGLDGVARIETRKT